MATDVMTAQNKAEMSASMTCILAIRRRVSAEDAIETLYRTITSTDSLNLLGELRGSSVLRRYLIGMEDKLKKDPQAAKLYTWVEKAFPELSGIQATRLLVREFFPEVNSGAIYPNGKDMIMRVEQESVAKKSSVEDVQTVFLAIAKKLGLGPAMEVVPMPDGSMLDLNNFEQQIGDSDPEDVLRTFLEANIDAVRAITVLEAFVRKPLTVLPEPMRLLTGLHTLSVAHCGLLEIPRWIGEWKDFSIFKSTGNPINSIPFEMSTLPLFHLKIDGGQVTRIPNWIGRVTSLKQLHLPNNQIVRLPVDDLAKVKLKEMYEAGRATFNLTGNPIPPGEFERLGITARKPIQDS